MAIASPQQLLAFADTTTRPELKALFDKAKAEMIASPQAALDLAVKAEKATSVIPQGREHQLVAATALWLQSEAKIRLGDDDGAAPLIERALRLIRDIPQPTKLRGDLMLARGGVQSMRMQPAKALESYQAAFRIFRAAREPRSMSIALQSIAVLYSDARDYANAEKYFEQASEVYEGDPSLLLFTYNNRGTVLLNMERSAQAVEQYRRALAIADTLDSPLILARVHGNLARAYLSEGNLNAARQAIDAGLRIAQGQIEARAWEPQLTGIKAQLELQEGHYRRAANLISSTFSGVDLASTTFSFRDAHVTAYKVYRELGENRLALQHLEAVRRLNEDATKLAISTNTALMAARFDYANQELKIANLKAEELRRTVAFERAQARSQRMLFGGLATAALVVLGLLSVGLYTIRRSRNEVRAANVILADTNVALEKALKAKTEFLATTSHEIRTPLNGILGMTQVMLADGALPPATRDRIGVVHGAGMTMRALVDDILDVAKMETGNLTVEPVPFDLPATLREVTRMWEEQARAKDLVFVLDVDRELHWIESDPGRLRQIVFNLLSNAVKFTEEGAVTVSAEPDGDRLRIAVRDTGVGIPLEQRDAIFESFKQVDAGTTRRFGGTGLGLTICRNLARALGGDVRVESVPGEGSVFTLDLPLTRVSAPMASAAAPEQGGGGALLILDRNPIMRSMLKTLVEPHAPAIRFAANTEEALAAIERGEVARLLMDEATIRPAQGDPAEAIRPVLLAAAAAKVHVAALWSASDEAGRAALAEAGVEQVIAKPVTGAALTAALFGETGNSAAKAPLVSRAA